MPHLVLVPLEPACGLGAHATGLGGAERGGGPRWIAEPPHGLGVGLLLRAPASDRVADEVLEVVRQLPDRPLVALVAHRRQVEVGSEIAHPVPHG